jgi:hypothetical protein
MPSEKPKTQKGKKSPPPVRKKRVTPAGEKSAVGRKCSICTHPEKAEINAKIARGLSFRSISLTFWANDSHRFALSRHTENCLHLDMSALIASGKLDQAVDHYNELVRQLEFASALQESCKQLLTDFDTGKISLEPRADEITVMYYDHDQINPLTMGPAYCKKRLQLLLNDIRDNSNKEPDGWVIKMTDMREYALKTIAACDVLIEKFAKYYRVDKETLDADLKMLKEKIMRRADEKGIFFHEELKNFLENYSDKLQPQIRSILHAEMVTTTIQ